MSYNKDTDYQSKIDEAVKSGDYKSAALYEKTRNEKIDGENLNYKKTNNYSGWLDSTDYGTVIKNQIKSGASKKAVADTLKKRQEKASGTVGLSQYAYDDIYDSAVDYLLKDDGFTYNKKKPSFDDDYSADIKKLYKKLTDREKFSYNPYEDELYSYYLDAYRREGSRAMEDLLGKLSASTGGIASSYATLAASQAYDYYNQKAADVIPQLYESAYKKHNDETKNLINELLSVQDMRKADYDIYQDAVKEYEKDRDFSYKKYLDDLESDFLLSEFGREILDSDRDYFQLLEKNIFDAQKEENRKDEKAADDALSWNKFLFEQRKHEEEAQKEETQTAIENALKRWKTLGYLDSESAKILDLPEGLKVMGYK